jgi:hypothetical protein
MTSIAQRVATITARANFETERRSWTRAIAARVMACGRNEDGSKIVKSAWPTDDRALALTKGGVSPTTSTGGYPQWDPVIAYRSLAPASAALALFQLGTALNLQGAHTIRIPAFANMPVQPVFVEEGKPAPNVQWNFDANTILGPVRKILMLAALTEELETYVPETASAVIGRVLADVANRGIDTTAFGTAAADIVKPAGLLHNVTPIAAASAGVDAMVDDLGNLAGAIGAAGIDASNVVYVAGPREAQIIKAKVGAKFNSPVLMTLGLPAKSVAAFAPEGVFSGYQDAPVIETTKQGAYVFDNVPTDISDGVTVAAPVKSQFQAAQISIKVRANCAWAVAAGAAQVIAAVNW